MNATEHRARAEALDAEAALLNKAADALLRKRMYRGAVRDRTMARSIELQAAYHRRRISKFGFWNWRRAHGWPEPPELTDLETSRLVKFINDGTREFARQMGIAMPDNIGQTR